MRVCQTGRSRCDKPSITLLPVDHVVQLAAIAISTKVVVAETLAARSGSAPNALPPAVPASPGLRLIIGQVTYRDFGVADFRERPKLFRDLVHRPGDQRLRRNAPIASAQRILQYRLCLCRGCADVDVAP